MSASVAPLAAVGGHDGWQPATPAIAAAAERVQQLQALIAQVEAGASTRVGGSGSGGATFASALDSAQSGAMGSAAAAGASYPAPAAGGYMTADSYLSAVPASEGSAVPAARAYSSAAPYPASAGAAGEGSAYTPLIEAAAARYGLDPAILHGLIQQESGFDPSARSSAGALGLTQLMPSTAASLGVTEPLDPAQSIEGGARYLSQLLHQFAGNTADALAAYNAGPGAVQQYGGVPPYSETQHYVAAVLGYAAAYSQEAGSRPPAPYMGAAAAPSAGGGGGAPVIISATGATPSEALA
ncbi:MAG: lytic transglycosylase domain-containing protein [Solirubrobacteraceae bacterium]